MIRVIMTLISAHTGAEEDLGSATIANIGRAASGYAYIVRLLKGAKYSKNPGKPWRVAVIDDAPELVARLPKARLGFVGGFPRTSRRCGPWDLLAGCLGALSQGRWVPAENEMGRLNLPRDAVGAMAEDLAVALTASDCQHHRVASLLALTRLVRAVADELDQSPREVLVRVAALMEALE